MKLEELMHYEFDGLPSPHDAPEIEVTDLSPDTAVDNPLDSLTMDVPLFIRLLEWAKEESQTDMDLHRISENALKLRSGLLTMKDYDSIIIQSLIAPGTGRKVKKYSLK
jgi:hypothetical protein